MALSKPQAQYGYANPPYAAKIKSHVITKVLRESTEWRSAPLAHLCLLSAFHEAVKIFLQASEDFVQESRGR
ncbi:hypothetical protein EVAR_24786_1 [Eumeta japonica]|uniref:Uncharacterized protein n=1 Tax=Eumeta variegata TaxID=151549 RepID=A0A4C1W1D8_EUMVA|nr:hypothetical protein EVAR_24786_1 [Eumeta japonica]